MKLKCRDGVTRDFDMGSYKPWLGNGFGYGELIFTPTCKGCGEKVYPKFYVDEFAEAKTLSRNHVCGRK